MDKTGAVKKGKMSMIRQKSVIMLVDDDIDFLEMNKHILETRGYRVLCYSDPQDALENMAKEKPNLVITDLMMKTLNSGFSFSQKIKENPRFTDIPVIIVTAVGSQLGYDFNPHTPEELEAMYADAYFEKPIAPEAFIAKVEELLD
jgi:CheY-like chemotaxis protein